MCVVLLALSPRSNTSFFTLENPAHRLRTLRNEHVLVLLEEESPREVNERKERKEKKRWRGNGTERERRRGNIHQPLQANLFHREASTTIAKPDRIQILEQIPQVSNEFHVKLYLIESKISPLSCARHAPKTYRRRLSPVSICNFRFLKIRSNLGNYTFWSQGDKKWVWYTQPWESA